MNFARAQLELDLAVSRAAAKHERALKRAAKKGATLKPVSESLAPQPEPEAPQPAAESSQPAPEAQETNPGEMPPDGDEWNLSSELEQD